MKNTEPGKRICGYKLIEPFGWVCTNHRKPAWSISAMHTSISLFRKPINNLTIDELKILLVHRLIKQPASMNRILTFYEVKGATERKELKKILKGVFNVKTN